MTTNLILTGDSYKYSHPWQYPPGTTKVSSYIEARGFGAPFVKEPEVCFFGLDAWIVDYLKRPVTKLDVEEAEAILAAHGVPFNKEGWMRIVERHGGYLPIFIEALAEGSIVPVGTPLVQINNIDDELPWITSFVETAMLRAVWYPTTVATLSREIKKVISKYLEETGDPAGIDFKLHDFGARGASSHESAAIGGLGHLVNFKGTDTIEAVTKGWHLYGEVLGYSIPASEHSTITSWGRENEVTAFSNMLDKWPTGLVACVSDSYDVFEACKHLWGDVLKDKVMNRDGTLVVRPDSGDPVDVTLKVIEILGERFGWTTNEKGYRVLDPHVRMIQGDGVNYKSIGDILQNFKDHSWSADNIAFGMGGALLQRLDRDSLKFAMKANEIVRDGTAYPVFKDPITDHGKVSKKGRQVVNEDDFGQISVIPETAYKVGLEEDPYNYHNLLKWKFVGGTGSARHFGHSHFQEIRQRAAV